MTQALQQEPVAQEPPSFGRALRLIWRALRRRCPQCGKGHPFPGRSWFTMLPKCPVCGAWFEREEGYFLGAMALNLIVAEFLPTGIGVAILIATWPNPPWTFLQFAAPLAMGLTPVVFYPYSKMLWLALDWTFRPPPTGRVLKQDHARPGSIR